MGRVGSESGSRMGTIVAFFHLRGGEQLPEMKILFRRLVRLRMDEDF